MVRRIFFFSSALLPLGIVLLSLLWPASLLAFLVVGPLIVLGLHDVLQRRHSLLRIYPIIGHGRFLMELVRPELQQYFVESNLDGRPINREFRSIVYQRAKGARDTQPFGTQRDVDRVGYEWMPHSLAPQPAPKEEPRVRIGGAACSQPYLSSHLNSSAMSFGSLSKTAVLSINKGARLAGFAQNTGEGGLSPYHLEHGGDLTWQIGTGYFGCRNAEGGFDADLFAEKAAEGAVKMIEIKLSQGAKPGHGGILPASKLTPEIAAIRHVPLGQDVISPPSHSAFQTPHGLLEFVARLRELSGGKPVGFKLCIGHPSEFFGICRALLETGIYPDFITVDGAEGGTGAAPLELTNSVGMPMRDGLTMVHCALTGIGLRDEIRVIVAGKIITGFHMVRALALGADLCNSARAMMLALGCIQARRCHSNECPVGVATQDPSRVAALDVADKSLRVARYQQATITAFLELVGVSGLTHPEQVGPQHVFRRGSDHSIQSLAEVYPQVEPSGYLESGAGLIGVPDLWRKAWQNSSAESYAGGSGRAHQLR